MNLLNDWNGMEQAAQRDEINEWNESNFKMKFMECSELMNESKRCGPLEPKEFKFH